MKKIILFTIVLFTTVQITLAQNTIAKLKYEEAEEAYASSNFELTVSKLDEVENILKATNPKILHLRIVALNQLLLQPDFKNDPELIPELQKACDTYIKKYENLENNYEKFKEVYKIGEAAKLLKTDDELDLAIFAKAKLGDSDSQFKIGLFYYTEDKYGIALKWYKKAANQGNTDAMLYIGSILKSTKKDIVTALKWYEMAANKGSGAGMVRAAEIYQNGGGTILVNNNKAIDWYKKAVEKETLTAIKELGIIYLEGKIVPKDANAALALFNRGTLIAPISSLQKRSASSIYNQLCILYLEGKDVNKDYAKVQEYANKGLDLKVEDFLKYLAKYLGDIYATGGSGIEKDDAKAFTFYMLSATKGGLDSMLHLSEMYATGKGVKKSKQVASYWKLKYMEEKMKNK